MYVLESTSNYYIKYFLNANRSGVGRTTSDAAVTVIDKDKAGIIHQMQCKWNATLTHIQHPETHFYELHYAIP